jgi:adenylate cyclase
MEHDKDPRKGRRVPFRIKIALSTGLTFLVLLLISDYALYRLASHRVILEMGRELMSVTATGAMDIDGEDLLSLTKPEQTGSPTYRRIQERLRRVKEANAHIRFRFLYTMVPTEKPGIWRYVVDSEDPSSPDFSALGSTEDFSSDEVWKKPLEAPLAEDKLEFYPGWGYLISASAPIRDRKGNSVGILGMDASAKNITETLENFRNTAFLFGLLGLVVSVLMSFFLAARLTSQLPKLLSATQSIEQGDFRHRVNVTTNDEMGDIAQALDRMAQGLGEREAYRRQFARYVGAQVAERVLPTSGGEYLDAVTRKAVLIHSSLGGFSLMARRLPGEESLSRLNEYLGSATDIVLAHGGVLERFQGDAFVALFGIPEARPDDAQRAVKAALALQQMSEKLSRRWHLSGFQDFFITIGLHLGEAFVTHPSSPQRSEYIAKGDSVEEAALLESLNLEHGTRIIASTQALAGLEKKVVSRPLGKAPGKERDRWIEIHSVTGWKEGA